MGLAEDLTEWTDCDVAQFVLGRALGLFPSDADFAAVKHLFWTVNPVGAALHEVLHSLVGAGVLAYRDEPDQQFRWRSAGGGGAAPTGPPDVR